MEKARFAVVALRGLPFSTYAPRFFFFFFFFFFLSLLYISMAYYMQKGGGGGGRKHVKLRTYLMEGPLC